MRVAITGTTGRVGAALARHLAPRHEVIPLPRAACDFSKPEALEAALDTLDCDVFINPAALTGLEACEDDPRLAMRVNSAAPGKIALWAADRGIRMIHFSTDYVFEGETTVPLGEDMPARPVNAYGRSKLAGEMAVLAHPGNLVLRVSWIFGPEKPSFVDQIFDAALAREPLAAVADKLCLPTCTTDLARWTETLLETDAQGILHACNPGPPVSWHGMAECVVREMTACGWLDLCPEVAALKLDEMPLFRASRPRFTVMDPGRLSAITGGLRPWPEALAEHVRLRCAAS
ncbi:MAG: NAD(P)-dependent oxidoreductase [Akkermansiaceae bacterium]|jgi:dTDP-4-dehydrorhamnose reductase|nr:NAD(P)-dependent oxidoreductase [Akkermansiaceae bacterium]